MDQRSSAPAAETADREIVISRVFDAPRELVWDAWTDPKHVVNWWGPRGFTTTIETMDVRVGGVWKHVMHGPDGTDYPNRSQFTEVVRPERIAYHHGGSREGGPGVRFESTWTFEALAEKKTRLTIRMVFATAADRDTVVREYGAIEGGKQTLGRLAEHLDDMAAEAAGLDYVISRDFDAPREAVFRAWTDPAQLARWFGPKTITCPVCELEARLGGRLRIDMRTPDGTNYPLTGTIREFLVPDRLLISIDTGGHPAEWHDALNALRPGGGRCADEVLWIVTFEPRAGKTRLTLRSRFQAAADRDAHIKLGMGEGWPQSLDRLGELLATE